MNVEMYKSSTKSLVATMLLKDDAESVFQCCSVKHID